MTLYNQIAGVLHLRGLDIKAVERAFRLQDDGDGPRISAWDTDTLGPLPTAQQLTDSAAAYAEYVAAESDREALAQVDARAIKATLEWALRQRTNWSSLTNPQKQAARDAARTEWIAIFKALG